MMTTMEETPKLSKSKFLAGCQCLKRLYLQVREPELAGEPDAAKQARFDQGHEVGKLATEAFPGGVRVEEDYLHHQKAVKRTLALMADQGVPAIFEAAFIFDGVRIRVDILERQTGNRWRLIEVKSTSKLKDEHYQDVAIQNYVLEGCGLRLSEACLMHLNRNYVYDGKAYVLQQLFAINDLTGDIEELRKAIPGQVAAQHLVLALGAPPEADPGDRCTKPYECEFYDLCNPEPPEHWLGNLPGMRKQAIKRLLDLGIELIHDIPEDFGLNDIQRRACLCVQTGEPYFGEDLPDELEKLEYPLYFMDFETFNPAIPRYRGMRPYDAIPFQWSVHVLRQPGGDLEHYEFLAEDANDPREAFIKSLLEVLEGSGGKGHVVVFYASFESGRLDDLAGWLLEYAARIAKIQARIWDLHPLVKNYVYHPQFYGSFSLKNVLPALVPYMTYEGMEIAEGTQAGLAYDALVRGELSQDVLKRLRKALLEYCGQDTLGMAELIKMLRNKANSKKRK
jgi:predicted RecB family nuclease